MSRSQEFQQGHGGREFRFYDMSEFREQRPDGRWLGEPDGVRVFVPGKTDSFDKNDQHGMLKLNHEGTHVDEIWVHPDHRRQGIATQMIRFAQEKTGRQLLPGEDRSDAGEGLARSLGAPPRKIKREWHGAGMYEP